MPVKKPSLDISATDFQFTLVGLAPDFYFRYLTAPLYLSQSIFSHSGDPEFLHRFHFAIKGDTRFATQFSDYDTNFILTTRLAAVLADGRRQNSLGGTFSWQISFTSTWDDVYTIMELVVPPDHPTVSTFMAHIPCCPMVATLRGTFFRLVLDGVSLYDGCLLLSNTCMAPSNKIVWLTPLVQDSEGRLELPGDRLPIRLRDLEAHLATSITSLSGLINQREVCLTPTKEKFVAYPDIIVSSTIGSKAIQFTVEDLDIELAQGIKTGSEVGLGFDKLVTAENNLIWNHGQVSRKPPGTLGFLRFASYKPKSAVNHREGLIQPSLWISPILDLPSLSVLDPIIIRAADWKKDIKDFLTTTKEGLITITIARSKIPSLYEMGKVIAEAVQTQYQLVGSREFLDLRGFEKTAGFRGDLIGAQCLVRMQLRPFEFFFQGIRCAILVPLALEARKLVIPRVSIPGDLERRILVHPIDEFITANTNLNAIDERWFPVELIEKSRLEEYLREPKAVGTTPATTTTISEALLWKGITSCTDDPHLIAKTRNEKVVLLRDVIFYILADCRIPLLSSGNKHKIYPAVKDWLARMKKIGELIQRGLLKKPRYLESRSGKITSFYFQFKTVRTIFFMGVTISSKAIVPLLDIEIKNEIPPFRLNHTAIHAYDDWACSRRELADFDSLLHEVDTRLEAFFKKYHRRYLEWARDTFLQVLPQEDEETRRHLIPLDVLVFPRSFKPAASSSLVQPEFPLESRGYFYNWHPDSLAARIHTLALIDSTPLVAADDDIYFVPVHTEGLGFAWGKTDGKWLAKILEGVSKVKDKSDDPSSRLFHANGLPAEVLRKDLRTAKFSGLEDKPIIIYHPGIGWIPLLGTVSGDKSADPEAIFYYDPYFGPLRLSSSYEHEVAINIKIPPATLDISKRHPESCFKSFQLTTAIEDADPILSFLFKQVTFDADRVIKTFKYIDKQRQLLGKIKRGQLWKAEEVRNGDLVMGRSLIGLAQVSKQVRVETDMLDYSWIFKITLKEIGRDDHLSNKMHIHAISEIGGGEELYLMDPRGIMEDPSWRWWLLRGDELTGPFPLHNIALTNNTPFYVFFVIPE